MDTNFGVGLMALLAKSDPEEAWREFEKSDHTTGFDGEVHSVVRDIIAEGLAAGFPKDAPWAKFFAKLPEVVKKEEDRVIWTVRRDLFGRWLESDAEAAEAWYNSKAGELISKTTEKIFEEGGGFEINRKFKLVEKKITFAAAAGFWLKRDSEGASTWLKGRQGLILEILQAESSGSQGPEERQALRKMLVSCLSDEEREKMVRSLLEGFMNVESRNETLKRLVDPYGTEESWVKVIAELKISEELADEILNALQ